jgi:acyl-CoA synthetase (AMP-forming)/AMP-acid ligase II
LTSRPRTLIDLLERAGSREDCGLRFVDRDERERFLSWREIRRRAVEAAGAVQAAGVAPGDRVALVHPTGPEFFSAFFGTLLAGAVPVPLYPPVRAGRLDEYHRRTGRMLRAVRARLVLAEPRVRRALGESVRIGRPELGCRTLESLGRADCRAPVVAPADLALVQFSSGTTVEPKPVALTHAAIVAQAELLNGFWPDGDGVRHSGVSWLPLYHDMGLIGCVGPALERPATLTLLAPEAFVARPASWLRAISRHRATISPAPNFAYALCTSRIDDAELDGVDLSCWRAALNGAETVVPAVLRSFAARFARWGFRAEALTPVYGLSEAALAVTFSPLGRGARIERFDRDALAAGGRAIVAAEGAELVSVGPPLPGFTLRVVDAQRTELPAGRVGRVEVRGPSLMRGYLDRPDLTAQALRDGWLDTGDLGFVRDGELVLTGRAKDMLLLRGRNHAPEEVEHAAQTVDGVRPSCAVAVSWLPEGEAGERLLVFVEARRGTPASRYEAIGADCGRAVLAATGLDAARVVVLDAGTLPRTSSGKLRRQETLRRHLAGALHPPEPVNPLRLARALLRSQLAYRRTR